MNPPKIAEVVPYLLAGRSIYVANQIPLGNYYRPIGGTYLTVTLDPAILTCQNIITAHIQKNTNKSETVIKDSELEIIAENVRDAKVYVIGGIEEGTITDAINTFGFDAILEGCRRKNVSMVHTAYLPATLRVAANQPALTLLGYLPARWGIITSAEGSATITMEYKIDLKTEIREMSAGNQVIIKAALKIMASLIKKMNGYAKHINDTSMTRATTQKAVLSSTRPEPPKKARYRHIGEGESICVKQKPVLRDLIEVTLMTETGGAMVGRKASKTGVVTDGIALNYNVKVKLKFMQFPGVLETDKCLVITNTGTGKIKVLFFTLKI